MDKEYLGLTISGKSLTLVHLKEENTHLKVLNDTTWDLQKGNRPKALNVMYQRLHDFIDQSEINTVFIKASAAPRSGVRLSHLKSAEHRGVILAASASACKSVKSISKAIISRTFGERNTDDYVSDDSFWESKLKGELRKGSRETAFLIIAGL